MTEFLNLTNIAGELFDKVVAFAVLKLAFPCSARELRVTARLSSAAS